MQIRPAVALAKFAILALLTLPTAPSPAVAGSVITGSCVGRYGFGYSSCVTIFRKLNPTPHITRAPAATSEQEVAEFEERDKRWLERCKPVTKQDQFGVPRYVYAARGCEFGALE
jgi:hypothetical protein